MVLLPATQQNELLLHDSWTIRNECPTCFNPAEAYLFLLRAGAALIAKPGRRPMCRKTPEAGKHLRTVSRLAGGCDALDKLIASIDVDAGVAVGETLTQ